MSYEKALQEYRQIRHVVREEGDAINRGTRCIYYTTQQRWLVHHGVPYSPAIFGGPPDGPEDAFIGVIDGRPLWQPVKSIWRDLPTVTEEEAAK